MRNIAFALVLFLLPSLAAAQFQKGDWDLTLGGSGQSDKNFETADGALAFSIGHFVSKEGEFGLRQTALYADEFSGSTHGFFNLHLGDGNFVPFIGANVGTSYGQESQWTAGPEAGLKYFVNSTTYLFVRAQYDFDLENGIDDGGFAYGAGIGFRW